MPSLTIRHRADEVTAAALLAPRDDGVVVERLVARGDAGATFQGVDGPFDQWHREVRRDGPDLIETFRFRFALLVWGPLFVPLLKHQLRRAAAAPPPEPGAVDRVPWWSPPDRLDARAARTLSAACTLAVLGGYIGALLGQTLTFVADDLGGSVRDQSWVLAVARIGALGTLGGMWWADRRGRRPVVLACFVIAALAAALAAAAPGLAWIGACQLVCRGAIAAGALLLPIAAAEDLPAGSRAFGMALVAMSGGLGVGILTVSLGLLDAAPWGWRVLHLIALLAVPATLAVGRHLGESRRFEALEVATRERGGTAADEHHMQLGRLWILGVALFLLWIFLTPVAQLQNDFLNNERGFSATGVSIFLVATNIGGGLGVVLGGQLADRRSRHLVATVGLTGLALGNALMFVSVGWVMWAGSAIGSTIGGATVPSFGVLSPELFPTSRRGVANGLLNLAAVVGSITGLLFAGRAIESWGYGRTMSLLAIGPLLVVVLLRWVPETARRELEEINP